MTPPAPASVLPAIGSPAPAFSLPDAQNRAHALSDFFGQRVILYFYPRDDTPGCTLEGCDFTKEKKNFEEKNAVVIGVSDDPPESHQKFAEKYALAHLLLSDVGGKTCAAYGVWVEKNSFGNKTMGIARTTFLIGANGTIEKIWHKVNPVGHAGEVLKSL